MLLGGQLVSQIGDKFHMLAVAFMVLKTTGSPAKMGLVLFCSVFPAMLLGIVSGAVVDRFNRKHVIVGADLARGLILSGICLLFYFDALSFPLLLTAQILLAVFTAFFDPAIPAVIPQIVTKEELVRANAQTQFVRGLATIVGPILGGIAVAWSGYLIVFIANALSFLISAGFESFIRIPVHNKRKPGKSNIVDDIGEGCRYVYRRKVLVTILVMVGVIHFFVGSVGAIIPVLAIDLRGGGPENIGFIQTFYGFGTVLAALYLSFRKIIDNREGVFLFGSVFAIGMLLLMVGGVHMAGIRQVIPFMLLFFGVGTAIIFAGTSFRTFLQKEVETAMMGRVFGFVASVGNITFPLATLICGLLMEYVSHNIITAASGFILMPVCFVAYKKFMAANTDPSVSGSLS